MRTWSRLGRPGQIGLIVFASVFLLGVVGGVIGAVGSSGDDSNDSAAPDTTTVDITDETTTEATTEEATTEEATTEETTTEAGPTPQERVQEAVGDEIEAGGFAGDLEIRDVSFERGEAQVTATTPEGGFEGVFCGDLDDGAPAVFETIYNDGGWKGSAVLIYQGGLVDTSTGEELPDVNTGIYTMPAGQAKQINWSDEDALLNIDWTLYRDFCHPALE